MKSTQKCPKWVGEALSYSYKSSRKKTFYSEFTFGSIRGKVGEFVLVSNADAVHPDTPEGCDVAKIVKLYETADPEDPYRAIVQWYSRPRDVPKKIIGSLQLDEKVEIVQDSRPFDGDVSIETFFSNCVVVGAKVDDDPVIQAKKVGKQIRVPVFVCRYKLVGSARLKGMEPYLNSDESELSVSGVSMIGSPSGDRIPKQNKSYQTMSLKVDDTMKIHLATGNHGVTEGNRLETTNGESQRRRKCDGHIQKSGSDLSLIKRINTQRNLGKDFDEAVSEHVKTKASEAMPGCKSYVLVKKLNLGTVTEDDVEDRDRPRSPPIPLTEPSMRWCGIKDGSHIKVLKIPIEPCVSDRKLLKSTASENMQPSVKDISLKDIESLTSDNELNRKIPLRNDEKKQMSTTKPAKSDKLRMGKEMILESKNFTHKTKLKDKDISQLLDDEEDSNDETLVLDKVIGKSVWKLKQRSSRRAGGKELESAVMHENKTSKASPIKHSQGSSGTSGFICSDRTSRGGNILKYESKLKINSIKPTSESSNVEKENSVLTSPSKNILLKKRHPEPPDNFEDTTKLKTLHAKSEYISVEASPLKSSLRPRASTALSPRVVAERLSSDNKVAMISNSESCASRSKNLCQSSAKKLSYEDNRVKIKLLFEESPIKRNVPDTSLMLKDETLDRTTNRSAKLSTPVSGRTNNSVIDMNPICKLDVIDYYLESMNSKTPNKRRILPQRSKDHWVSVLEDKNDGDTSSCSSSVRLKLCRTKRIDCDADQEIQAATPRRRKRQILSDSDNDSDYEPGSTSKSKRYKAHEPSTSKSLKTSPSLRVRSSSRKHKPNKWYESDWATPTTTPVRSVKRQVTHGTPLTPRTPKSGVALQASTTPVSKRGSARRLLLTPSVPTRASSVSTPGSVLEEARARLHVAAVPKSLPCREKEFENIYRFLEGKILDGTGGCMYISGVPGTGKTATVQEVIRSLQAAVSRRDIVDFQFIELNGMRLTEPRQAYVQLLKALTGQTVKAEQAQQLLERRFSRTAPRRVTTLLLVDELDLLWTRRQDVVYNLLDWPTKAASRLVVLTIANTMDLPERLLMGRVTSRLGLTRVTFHPYTHKQLQEIVMARLKGLQAFDPDAVQLVARKVAAVSGDARRALDICRRAAELAEGNVEEDDGMVTMQHADQALSEMIASSKVQAIRHCSKIEQEFLRAVAAEVQRTGVEETVFEQVCVQLKTLCILDGYSVPSITESLGLCARLGSYRLLLTEHSRAGIHQRILLNVSSDDIHYALHVQ